MFRGKNVILKLTVFSLLVLCFTGCSKKKSDRPIMNVNMVQQEDGTYLKKLQGTEKRYFQVEDGKTVDVSVKVTAKEGTLNMNIKRDGSEDPIYEGNDIPTSEFTVNATETGNYTIFIEADDFLGDYSINFSNY